MASMTQPLRRHIVGPFSPEVVGCGELQPGDLAVFDSMFGAELILERHEHFVGFEVMRDAAGAIIPPDAPGPMVAVPGSEWLFVRLLVAYEVADDHNTRYVFRAMHEPITRWRPAA